MRKTRALRLATLLAILAAGSWRADAEDPRGVKLVTIFDATGREVGLYEASYALVIDIADYTAG